MSDPNLIEPQFYSDPHHQPLEDRGRIEVPPPFKGIRFTVEPKGEKFVVRDNNPPEGSPFKDGLIYITPSEKLANEHAAHCNRSTRP